MKKKERKKKERVVWFGYQMGCVHVRLCVCVSTYTIIPTLKTELTTHTVAG